MYKKTIISILFYINQAYADWTPIQYTLTGYAHKPCGHGETVDVQVLAIPKDYKHRYINYSAVSTTRNSENNGYTVTVADDAVTLKVTATRHGECVCFIDWFGPGSWLGMSVTLNYERLLPDLPATSLGEKPSQELIKSLDESLEQFKALQEEFVANENQNFEENRKLFIELPERILDADIEKLRQLDQELDDYYGKEKEYVDELETRARQISRALIKINGALNAKTPPVEPPPTLSETRTAIGHFKNTLWARLQSVAAPVQRMKKVISVEFRKQEIRVIGKEKLTFDKQLRDATADRLEEMEYLAELKQNKGKKVNMAVAPFVPHDNGVHLQHEPEAQNAFAPIGQVKKDSIVEIRKREIMAIKNEKLTADEQMEKDLADRWQEIKARAALKKNKNNGLNMDAPAFEPKE